MRWFGLAIACASVVAAFVYVNRDDPADLSIAFRCAEASSGTVIIKDGGEQLARTDLRQACAGTPIVLEDAGRPDALVVIVEKASETTASLTVEPRRIEAEPDGYFLLLRVDPEPAFPFD